MSRNTVPTGCKSNLMKRFSSVVGAMDCHLNVLLVAFSVNDLSILETVTVRARVLFYNRKQRRNWLLRRLL
ncbi:hypothetical protein ERO13_D05G312566v2 [Gossypium hirsutum]|uniref:Uncharacterized protein n=3 Tax=Gossypium TaxID=3633 RepID=A0A0D2TG30_GOSRA|nr:hypothetical protein ES319_D05G333100v1 [Gossypium barbadense]KAG4148911.1 hypothetical protein ERO13_D05G312566v2 [Gossypium hirsutum]KJB53496.1 hypothetical protein B456_009G334000 [Gossypium raimondii]TYI84096.1 hypothetical protein E1A91_D05G340000v1 [Gossypium mustelinum]